MKLKLHANSSKVRLRGLLNQRRLSCWLLAGGFSLAGTGDGGFATAEFVKQVHSGQAPAFYAGGYIFAFKVLPTIIFFSALSAVLYHWNILQVVIKAIASVMQKTMKTSGAETLSASANIFFGQTEAPLLVRPYLNTMTQSELMTVMTGGFATTAGGTMMAYIGMLVGVMPNIAGHLMAASVMSAPAALLFGKLLVPETRTPETSTSLDLSVEKQTSNVFDAITVGTTDGVKLALNIGGMLIAFLALIALVDLTLGGIGRVLFGGGNLDWLNLRGLAGFFFAPFAFLMGITEWSEALQVGKLLGIKTIANEFIAF